MAWWRGLGLVPGGFFLVWVLVILVEMGGEERVLAFAFYDELLERTGWSERHTRLHIFVSKSVLGLR